MTDPSLAGKNAKVGSNFYISFILFYQYICTVFVVFNLLLIKVSDFYIIIEIVCVCVSPI